MSIPCPHCDRETTTVPKNMGGGGLIGIALGYALAGHECRNCGTIDWKDFPEETQSKLRTGMILKLAATFVGFVVLVGGITYVMLQFDQ